MRVGIFSAIFVFIILIIPNALSFTPISPKPHPLLPATIKQQEEKMAEKIPTLPFFFIFWLFFNRSIIAQIDDANNIIIKTTSELPISRSDFPSGFIFGAGSSAYQVEGAVDEDGRKPSIWDTFTHAGKIFNKITADITSDQYHKYKDDVKLMHKMGLDAYRFSISWSRLIPDGRGAVNPKGLNYYNSLIDELVSYGIEAHVTLSHFDIPQALQDEYDGILSSKFIEDFTAYAEICFKEFGDRVKSWMTFNEPNLQTILSNDVGFFAPGRCSYPYGFFNCSEGDSKTEPYLAAHNLLLSHAAAVHLYRQNYQDKQKGHIGITLLAFWLEPITDSYQDLVASQRALDFHIGWFFEPLLYGNYPATMRKIVRSRLPSFTEHESKQLMGSFDFIGINHYCLLYVQDVPISIDDSSGDYMQDASVRLSFTKDGLAVDYTKLKASNIPVPSQALRKVLEYVRVKYKNPAVVIHENGFPMVDQNSSSRTARNDTERVEYLQGCIDGLLTSIRNGSNAMGYFVWSFVDCFEYVGGYTSHYGLYGVDFNDKDRERYPRQSAH